MFDVPGSPLIHTVLDGKLTALYIDKVIESDNSPTKIQFISPKNGAKFSIPLERISFYAAPKMAGKSSR